MGISEEEKRIMQPRGGKTLFSNRARWALTYLMKSVLLEKTEKGKFKITRRGSEVLQKKPSRINDSFLHQFSEFRLFKGKSAKVTANGDQIGGSDAAEYTDATPDERLDAAYKELRETLADDLLEKVRSGTDKFFEYLVVDLLVAMGYGGSQADRGRVVGKSGDGGIDGVIQEDRLGLDTVYVQAKKWQNPVGPDEIRKFVGSLGEQKAHKGVFITSGAFTNSAHQAAEKANAKVVLIDGEQLAQLMIDHGVGVADHKIYNIKKLDGGYFDGI
jgi:restriction system protein